LAGYLLAEGRAELVFAAHRSLIKTAAEAGAQYDEAIKGFKEVIRIDPTDSDTHFELGSTYMEVGHRDLMLT
jgi:Flp pilus assembly protein TadD